MKKLGIAAVSALILTGPAMAQTADRDVLEALGRCASIADGNQRLACYDAATPRLKTALVTPPPILTRPATREEESSWFGFNLPDLFGGKPETQTTAQQFGSNNLPAQQRAVIASGNNNAPAAPVAIDSISAGVTSYALNEQNRYVLFLDNGQVWRQQAGDSGVMQFRRNAPNVVRITRGFWDSYNLKLNSGSALYKVVRVK